MIETITDKLHASVVRIEDVERTYPGVASFRGRVALDVRVERGCLSVGKRVQLSGPQTHEQVEIVGIEMILNLNDPSVVRVVCSRPVAPVIPTGPVEGWMIAEQ
jgi:translation elongation factor EF-Tu-like GTPase